MKKFLSSIIEYLINVIDLYHQNRIKRFYNSFNLDLVIDVGSHKGEFINSVLTKNIPIYSFEPNPAVMIFLKENTKLFNVISYFDYAITDKDGNIEFFVNHLSSTSSLSAPNDKSFWIKFKKLILGSNELIKETISVKAKKLDSILLDEIKNYHNALLKIDVEGSEGRALYGARKIIGTGNIKFIQIEQATFDIYKDTDHNPNKILNELGFIAVQRFRFPLLNFSDVIFQKVN